MQAERTVCRGRQGIARSFRRSRFRLPFSGAYGAGKGMGIKSMLEYYGFDYNSPWTRGFVDLFFIETGNE